MDYDVLIRRTKKLLSQLQTIDFGYPLGENILRDPSIEIDARFDSEITQFYSQCDGLSWPNVVNGYFIRKSSEFGKVKNEYDPISIEGDLSGEIAVLGSTGSGVLFARRSENGQILALPPAKIAANIYYNSDCGATIIANSLKEFYVKLMEDLQAFVEDRAEHQFLGDRQW